MLWKDMKQLSFFEPMRGTAEEKMSSQHVLFRCFNNNEQDCVATVSQIEQKKCRVLFRLSSSVGLHQYFCEEKRYRRTRIDSFF